MASRLALRPAASARRTISLCSCDYISQGLPRCYGTVTNTRSSVGQIPSALDIPDTPRYSQTTSTTSTAVTNTRKDDSVRLDTTSGRPSVLVSKEAAARTPLVHKIHILGEDIKSKWIAHALSEVHDQVELMAWTGRKTRYTNIRDRVRNKPVEANRTLTATTQQEKDPEPIKHLIVTGSGSQAKQSIHKVKDRLDENSTVCLMSHGLGVLEDVRNSFFRAKRSRPDFLLGHMNHTLQLSRDNWAVEYVKRGAMKLTTPYAIDPTEENPDRVEQRVNFVKTLQTASVVNASLEKYDTWLRAKLPSLVYSAVAEPVSVMMGVPIKDLVHHPPARSIMGRLLKEIQKVLLKMPEVRGSQLISRFAQDLNAQNVLQGYIHRGRDRSTMTYQQCIDKGVPTDAKYLNGYFYKKGRKLGVYMPSHRLVWTVVEAKHGSAIYEANTLVPFEATSLPAVEEHRLRTTESLRKTYRKGRRTE
ncbi:uncharacterized protein F5Z01DRAFT_656265 [Emericellopsis atlantica]|uniref:Uncharacterized protein n=1 Tax=Emericellopsis atlantica TaxID=2614577 RepID=A0A9P7ZM36_9HYPO|nr:uncharacterized protein F5Z01DRAFT_656265 [Emericellopsis atlantica]KAG9254207.1 hypothetical protein F5Z01DRAFT_656265 [Emericellopsis atlantica]